MPTVRTPYTDSNIQRRIVSEMIKMIDWTQVPLLKRLGWEKDKTMSFSAWPPGGGKKLEWIEDSMQPRQDTLDGAVNASQLTFAVDNGSYWHQGHIMEIDSEQMVVESVTGNTVTVASRGAGGTTAATHNDATAIYMRGIAKKTGANYTIGYTTTMSLPHNFTQIVEESVRVNRDQREAKDYGVSDTMAYHLAKLIGGTKEVGEKGRTGQLPILLTQMAYYGKRQQPTDLVPGMAGGFETYITSNLYGNTSTAMSRPQIHEALRDIYNAGGEPDLIVTSPWGAEKITSFYEGAVRTERSEERGGSVIRYIDTPVRESVEVMIDWQCPSTKSYILDSERVGWVTVRPFKPEDKPSLGDYDVVCVLGEYSFVVCNESAHAIITHSSTL